MGKARDISRVLNDAGLVGAPDLASTLDLSTKTITLPAGAVPVTSVNGQTGAVVVDVPVTSVAGKTGAVTLDKTDVGLSNVANVDQQNASNLTSGTVGTARLGSGTASSSTFLRGDGSWQTVSGGVTSLNGQTGSIINTSVNGIGAWQRMYYAANGVNTNNISLWVPYGTAISGASLRYNATGGRIGETNGLTYLQRAGSVVYNGGGAAPSGTWRLMDHSQYFSANFNGSTRDGRWFDLLFVRIS